MTEFSSLVDEIAMQFLQITPETNNQELVDFQNKVKHLLEISDKTCPQETKEVIQSIIAILEKVIKGQNSFKEVMPELEEKITQLQKLSEKETQASQNTSEAKGEQKEVSSKEVAITINPEEDPELYQDFINESREHLESIEVNIINLEQNPEDKEVINTIFRPFHTIKGVAGFLGLEPINKLSHAAESLLDAARNGELKINSQVIDVILEAVDMLKAMVDDVEAQLTSGNPTQKTFNVDELIAKIESIKSGEPVSQSPEAQIPLETPKEEKEAAAETPKQTEEGEELIVNFEEDFDLYRDFINEAREHLSSIELNIINLEQNPTDKEVINSIFRPFHTIKGVAGFLNLEIINKLAHTAENLLDAARSGNFSITEEAIDVILEAVDMLKAMIDDLENQIATKQPTGKKFAVKELINKIEALRSGKAVKQQTAETPSKQPEEKTKPEEKPAEAPKPAPQPTQAAKPSEKEKKAPVKEMVKPTKSPKLTKASATIKIDTQKLDNLIDMIGELLITQSMIMQNPVINNINDQKLVRDLSQLARITSELQKVSMSLRMVPIKETFQKMIRLVRDLSKKSGKKVQLIMQGEDTEIDRNMVEELYDPLVHMIRNSVDHGIEMPDERKAKGKPETGTVELMAYHKGGNIVIEIRDDGRGLDKEKILKKAIERGLVSEGEKLSDQEIYQLIFKPGFSTADKVTEISGRGVGMDVVKKAIDKLRGKIEIKSQKDKGATFIIKLPLTLAIIDGIIIGVGKERYILPTIAVQEVFKPTREQYQTYAQQGEMIKIRENIFPIVRLHRLFNVKPKYTNPWDALMVLVESEDEYKCLMVDEVLGKQEVVIKSLGEALGRVKGIAGGAIMGDGKVGLILDVTGIFEMSES